MGDTNFSGADKYYGYSGMSKVVNHSKGNEPKLSKIDFSNKETKELYGQIDHSNKKLPKGLFAIMLFLPLSLGMIWILVLQYVFTTVYLYSGWSTFNYWAFPTKMDNVFSIFYYISYSLLILLNVIVWGGFL